MEETMNREKLIAEAFKAMKNSYAPYSKYHVGAAILT
ncbi:MAG: cytidine deaminase, partial [Latilactobacillus curvatus]